MPFIEVPDDFDISTIEGAKEYTPPDIDGLKSNANKILSEKKAREAELAEMQANYASLQAELKKGKVKGDDDALSAKLEDAMAKINALTEENGTIKKQHEQSILTAEASKLVAAMKPLNDKAANILTKEVMGRLALDNGELSVLDANGKPTISQVNELQAEMTTAYDFLVAGSQAAGGGAQGSRGGAASTKTVSRSEFDAMDQNQRFSFVKDGGKISETE